MVPKSSLRDEITVGDSSKVEVGRLTYMVAKFWQLVSQLQ